MCGQTDPTHRICAYDTGFRPKKEEGKPAEPVGKTYKYDE